jgi:hypothetical protein
MIMQLGQMADEDEVDVMCFLLVYQLLLFTINYMSTNNVTIIGGIQHGTREKKKEILQQRVRRESRATTPTVANAASPLYFRFNFLTLQYAYVPILTISTLSVCPNAYTDYLSIITHDYHAL